MTDRNRGLGIGIAISLIGLIAIMANLQVIRNTDHLLGAGVFWIIAFVFFQAFEKDRSRKWSLWCAILFAFFGLATIVRLLWHFPDELIGLAFLWGGAALFGSVYAKRAKHWWAIIPAGLLFTLGVIVAIDAFRLLPDRHQGVIFFFGFGLTFVYLWSQDNAIARLTWAKYPAAVMILLALFILAEGANWLRMDVILPVVLVLLGAYFIFSAIKRR